MSFQEVKKLRKNGRLREAFKLAKKNLRDNSNDIWNRRAMAWVQHDLIKNALKINKFSKVPAVLKNIDKLDLSEDEEILFEQLAWKIGKVVKQINKSDSVDYELINEIFDEIKDFHFPKPSEPYSFLYSAFHKGYENWDRYLEFAQWWDFENFLSQDYNKTELGNGRQIMSNVERAYIAYSKKILEGRKTNQLTGQVKVDEEQVRGFLKELDNLIDRHPEYRYPIYYKAKLLHELGEEEEALHSILPFARKKKNEYWIWDLLAKIAQDDELRLACLSKALLCKSDSGYLVKVRKFLASELIEIEYLPEAKTEIEKLVATREENDWNISDAVKNWVNSDWYSETVSKESNKEFYLKWAPKAERLLFQDIKPETVIVEYVNYEKNILNFIDKEKNKGFFNYSSELEEVSVGDVVDVRFDRKEGEYHTIFTAEKNKNPSSTSLIKQFENICEIVEDKNFGFIDDIFLPPDLVDSNNLNDGQMIKGKAIPSYDKKKGKWGWKAFEIENIDQS